jgi:outer membrane protein assembly factor BamA
MNMLQGSLALPLDRVRRIGLHLGARQDVLDFKAQDSLSLIYTPRDTKYWLMSRAEYVFDNSRPLAQNLRTGFRYKVFAEYMYGLSKTNKGGMYNLGLDFRYYKPVYKNVIFAARIAGAHSGGEQKILYMMGGVDNWIKPKYGNPAPNNDNYAFQAQATNMRGYKLSDRTGNTYALGNFELRAPILSTILQRPIQSDLLRSLQLVGFADAGSAWNGLVPNGENLNNEPIYINSSGTVIATAKIPSGFALGYGAGLRGQLLGYFLRLDAAWNIQGAKKPIWYFSIGTDF